MRQKFFCRIFKKNCGGFAEAASKMLHPSLRRERDRVLPWVSGALLFVEICFEQQLTNCLSDCPSGCSTFEGLSKAVFTREV
jgi:hypothetical protein